MREMLPNGHDVEGRRVEQLSRVRLERDRDPKPCMLQDAGESRGLVGVVLDEQNGQGGARTQGTNQAGPVGIGERLRPTNGIVCPASRRRPGQTDRIVALRPAQCRASANDIAAFVMWLGQALRADWLRRARGRLGGERRSLGGAD